MPQVLIRKIDALLAEEAFEWIDVNDISGKLMGIPPEAFAACDNVDDAAYSEVPEFTVEQITEKMANLGYAYTDIQVGNADDRTLRIATAIVALATLGSKGIHVSE